MTCEHKECVENVATQHGKRIFFNILRTEGDTKFLVFIPQSFKLREMELNGWKIEIFQIVMSLLVFDIYFKATIIL